MFHFDLVSLGHALASLIAGLALPLVLLVVLASALGGNGQNIGESLAETLSTLMVMIFEILTRLTAFICIGLVAVLSASVRWLLGLLAERRERQLRNKVKLKIGGE